MSHTSNPNNFASPESLSEWLKPRLPSDSFASWGVKPGTKNIHNLWLELSHGETSLHDSNPPIRTVQVVMVRITGSKDGKFLLESHHELSDGTVSERNRPLTEKMKLNEDPEFAALRGIKEELGSVISIVGSNAETTTEEICDMAVTIDLNSYEMRVEERNSETYPGLPGSYIFHTFNALVQGLPETDFCSYEADDEYCDSDYNKVAHQAVSVKKHYWKWVSVDSKMKSTNTAH